MPFNTLYKSGPWRIILSFAGPEENDRWIAETQALKDTMENIHNDDNDDDARVPLYRAWLADVNAFAVRWGGENWIAPDIKHAVNTVENGIGIQETTWVRPPSDFLRPITWLRFRMSDDVVGGRPGRGPDEPEGGAGGAQMNV